MRQNWRNNNVFAEKSYVTVKCGKAPGIAFSAASTASTASNGAAAP
jgi:hypothetical protein